MQREDEGPRLGLLQQLLTLLVLFLPGYVQSCLSCLVHSASGCSPFQQQLEAVGLVVEGSTVHSAVPVSSFGIQVTTILDDEIHQGQGGLVGDSDSQVQGELSRRLPLRPWQQLSKVMPICEGL